MTGAREAAAGDIAALSALVNGYGRRISNDYMLARDWHRLAAHGKLSYACDGKAVFLFERREGYLKLHFRLKETGAELPEVNEPLVAYTVYRGAPADGAPEEWLSRNGFYVRQERLRYAAKELTVPPGVGGVSPAGTDEAYAVYAACFDLLAADLPCRELFEGAVCVRGGEGRAVGVLSNGAGRHIAVLPEYRGRGVASRLYSALAAGRAGGAVTRVWTDADNPASNAMYRRFGFAPDGMTARCYVRGG